MEELRLIDWRTVGAGALWVAGLALLLSVLGFLDYQAKARGERRRDLLREPGYRRVINVSLGLFTLGMAGLARDPTEAILWLGLSGAFGVLACLPGRRVRDA